MNSQREILEAVARGDLSPQEAVDQLADVTHQTPPNTPDRTTDAELGERSDVNVTTVRIAGAFQSAKIVGDPTVATAVVDEGAHRVTIDGTTLTIDAGPTDDRDGFSFDEARIVRTRLRIGLDSRPAPLRVRMNPQLALETEVAAGSITVTGVHGPIKAEVAAGACRLEDVRAPFDITVATGAVKVAGRLTTGESTIRCETGGVKVILDSDSSVRITARAGLGKVSLPGVKSPSGLAIGSSASETTLGNGDARLKIECSLGAVKVAVSEDA